MNAVLLNDLMLQAKICWRDREFITDGFSHGFDLGYRGLRDRRNTLRNLPFSIGDKNHTLAKTHEGGGPGSSGWTF